MGKKYQTGLESQAPSALSGNYQPLTTPPPLNDLSTNEAARSQR